MQNFRKLMIKLTKKLHVTLIQIIFLLTLKPIIANHSATQASLQKIVTITQLLAKKNKQNLSNIVEITKLLHQKYKPEIKAKKLLKKKIKARTRNHIQIENINLQPHELNRNGHPTPQALEKLLIQEYFPKFHKNLRVEAFKGGNINEALYRVFDKNNKNKAIFFLKISPSNDIISEAEKLDYLQQSAVGRLGLDTFYYPNSKKIIPKKYLPKLVWVDRFWIYQNQYNQEKIIEVTHAAHGSTVFNTLQSNDQDLKNKCVQALAKALASFQQAFMICPDLNNPASWFTISHQDLHPGNILFDPKTLRIYFIDNANMQPKKSWLHDLSVLWYCISDKQLRFLFLSSYIDAYPENKQKMISDFIKNNM